jgi:hypothetical protein
LDKQRAEEGIYNLHSLCRSGSCDIINRVPVGNAVRKRLTSGKGRGGYNISRGYIYE